MGTHESLTQYRNKYNGRIVTLIGSEITDSGNTLHSVRREDGDHKGSTDFIGQYQLEKHWEFITASQQSFNELRLDAEFVVDDFSRADLIDHLVTLYRKIEEHDCILCEPNDACDTHSQTINTSDGED